MKTLFVALTLEGAQKLQEQFNMPGESKAIGSGGALCAYGADLIIVDDLSTCLSDAKQEMIDKWYKNTIPCRLLPGGKIYKEQKNEC